MHSGRKMLCVFSSAPVTAALLIAIAAASAYGSFLPPPRAATFYSSNAFALLLAVLFVHLLAGVATGIRRSPGFLLIRIGFILVLLGAFSGRLWGERGTARLYEGQETKVFGSLRGEAVKLGFTLRLDSFQVERYTGGEPEVGIQLYGEEEMSLYPVEIGRETGPPAIRVTPLRYLPDFRMDAGGKIFSGSAEPNNPALEVEVESGGESETGWLFARFPSFPPAGLSKTLRRGRIVLFDRSSEEVKSYRSVVTLLDDGETVASGTVTVNRPMKFGGYRIYQSDYDPVGWQWSGLKIVRDPGLPLVYAGYLFLALGVTLWVVRGDFGGREG